MTSILAEEAGEIVQACNKALRFGLDDHRPGSSQTNADDIALEVAHLNAVAAMLDLELKGEDAVIAQKIAKVQEFMEYALQRGTLQ